MPAGAASILLPVFVQVLLTLALMLIMGRRRFRAVSTGDVKIRDVALSGQAWPDAAKQAANSYTNQFELPVLFYTVVGFALITGQVTSLMVGLAWAFVVARLVHAGIHISSNRVQQRFMAFLISATVVAAMWGVLAMNVLTAGA